MDSLGEFRVVSPLGQGVSTQTFRVEHGGLFAVGKRLAPRFRADDDARQAFDTEVEVLRALDGRAAPRLLARGVDGHGPWLVEDALPSPSLATYVGAHGAIGASTVVFATLVDLALGALAEVHDACARDGTGPLRIVHGDLSPENLLVRLDVPSPAVWLIDFGLATFGSASAAKGSPGALRGTPRYLSPEVARGMPASSRSDLFSLGLALLFAASNEAPRCGHSLPRMLLEAGEESVLPFAERAGLGLSPEHKKALEALLAHDPDERPATARVAREAWRSASW